MDIDPILNWGGRTVSAFSIFGQEIFDLIIALGAGLVLIGLVTMAWGDKVVTKKRGRISTALAWEQGSARWRKWPTGLMLVFAGIVVIYGVWL